MDIIIGIAVLVFSQSLFFGFTCSAELLSIDKGGKEKQCYDFWFHVCLSFVNLLMLSDICYYQFILLKIICLVLSLYQFWRCAYFVRDAYDTVDLQDLIRVVALALLIFMAYSCDHYVQNLR